MKSNLKYLYRVVYLDGTVYDQNVEDISTSDNTKSCYNDIKLDQIHYFTLSDGYNSYTLDVTDGGFSVNGSPKFYLSTKPLTNFKLIHHRRVTLELNGNERKYKVNFILGYEAGEAGDTLTNYIIIK